MSRIARIKAPLAGTFYASPDPGAPPFVTIGQRLGPDDVVGIVESMKLFIEVRAELRGIVHAILVKNEVQVAKDQDLVEVEIA